MIRVVAAGRIGLVRLGAFSMRGLGLLVWVVIGVGVIGFIKLGLGLLRLLRLFRLLGFILLLFDRLI